MIMEITTRLTHRSLMNKSKSELAMLLLEQCDITEKFVKDAERLDWLCAQKYGCWGIDMQEATWGTWQACIETGGESYRGKTLRESIDAARKVPK